MAQNNLGNALCEIGERRGETESLEEAVAAFREALKEYTRERVPLDWARTQSNLDAALRTLGKREAGTTCLQEAQLVSTPPAPEAGINNDRRSLSG
jgi:tetratricopeptide (TPR) repeat protein